jgi:hypothetical protein
METLLFEGDVGHGTGVQYTEIQLRKRNGEWEVAEPGSISVGHLLGPVEYRTD